HPHGVPSSIHRRPPNPTLFPYTTLFRSQEKIARRNRRDRPGAELREKSGAPHRATKQYEERRAQQENRAQKEQHDQGREMRSRRDRKSTRLNSSHGSISYAVFCLKKKTN